MLDPKWRCSGDAEWMVRLMRAGLKMSVLNEFTSVFTQTGTNLSFSGSAVGEAKRLRASAPFWARCFRPAIVAHHRLRRLLGGMYRQQSFSYKIFTIESRKDRKTFETCQPVGRIPKSKLLAAST